MHICCLFDCILSLSSLCKSLFVDGYLSPTFGAIILPEICNCVIF